MKMRRFLLNALWLLIVLFAVTTGIAWYLLQDEAFLKSQLRAYALKHTGRELAIDGILRVDLGRTTTVEAQGIRFANASWADEPDMARIGHLRIGVRIPSLFGDTPVIPQLLVEDCSVSLVEREGGEANWAAMPADEPAPEPERTPGLPALLLDTQIHNCSFSHDAPTRERPLNIAVDELALRLIDGDRWQGSGAGRVDNDALSFTAKLASAGALLHGEPLQFEVEMLMGLTSLRSSGSIDDPSTGQGANLTFNLQGPEMATVLDRLKLPALSAGAFDFRLTLDTEGEMTELSIDGDLGSLDLNASGQLDRLVRPQSGVLTMALTGPNLEALGEALGAPGMVPEPYSVQGDVLFEGGIARAQTIVIETAGDHIEVSGVLNPAPPFPDSDLTLHATSQEIGRWNRRLGLPVATEGPMTLDGRFTSDADGLFSTQAQLSSAGNSLSLNGTLGSGTGLLEPDLQFTLVSPDAKALAGRFGFDRLPAVPGSASGRLAVKDSMVQLHAVQANLGAHQVALDGVINPARPYTGSSIAVQVDSPNVADLGQLFQRQGLPAATLTLQGKIRKPDSRIHLQDVDLALDVHRARINGYLQTDKNKVAGNEIEILLDSPDVGELALLFGQEGLPHEPMELSAELKPVGKGLEFHTSNGSLGAISLAADGHIPDLDRPLALDAKFDIRLPSLTLLEFLTPDRDLPDLPFTAAGQLHNRQDRSELENVRLTLGDFSATLAGEVYQDRRFALSVEAGGPDASALQPWLGQPLLPEPFSVRTRLTGDPSLLELQGIEAQLGKSRAGGDLQIGLGTPKTFRGNLTSPYLDLTQWNTGEEDEQPVAAQPSSAYVFDDTPVMWIGDFGFDTDFALEVAQLDLGNTQLHDIELGVRLGRNRLELSPFSLRGQGGGTFHGRASLDDSGDRPVLDVEMDAKDLRLGLSAVPGQDPSTIPALELQLLLHGTGFTRREMASSLHGKLRAYGGPGQIATAGVNLLFSDFLTQLFEALDPLAETSEYTGVDCTVFAADIVAGDVTVDPMVAQLEGFTILSEGTIDLRSEKINLSFNTKPRKGLGITPGTVINTIIKVGGTLKTPAIELDPAGAVVAGTLGFATAGLSVLARGFSDRFLSSKDPCGDARKEIEKRDR